MRLIKTDSEKLKNRQFERKVAEYMEGFIQCYPHLIEKIDEPETDTEMWIMEFYVADDK